MPLHDDEKDRMTDRLMSVTRATIKGTAMFISVRKYHGVRSVEEVKRRVEQEFVPVLKQNPGF